MRKNIFRIVTREADGRLHTQDFSDVEEIFAFHTQTGTDDCSVHKSLRGLPVFKGLIGPLAEGANIIRYETPEVFETLTKEWVTAVPVRRCSHQVKRNL